MPNNAVPISPKTWLRQCTSINTDSGDVVVVVDGVVVRDNTDYFFKNKAKKPTSLKDKLLLMKNYIVNGMWFQVEFLISNVNVFK